MNIQEKIVKRNGKYFVISEDGSKKLGGPFASRTQAVERLQKVEHFKEKDTLVWEVQDLSTEIIEKEGQPTRLKLTGTAVVEGTSRNGVKYSYKNLEECDGSRYNYLVGHREDYDNPDHNVGEGKYFLESNKLKFEGSITNNAHHPDIIEQAQKELIAVSVQGKAKVNRVGGEVVVESMRIPLLCLINKHTRGIEGATIESAIAERLQNDDFNSKLDEVDTMSEELLKQLKEKDDNLSKESIKLQTAVKEKEELQKKFDDYQKTIKEAEDKKEKEEKEKVVESLLKLNKDLDAKQLNEKPINELHLMETYEKKIQGVGNGEQASQVKESEDGKPDKDELKGIIYEANSGIVRMDDERYEQFNKDLAKSIYR